MLGLSFGVIVGFSLGLTGGGGSIFAVPLLVYGLGLPIHQAVGISLAAVGTTALSGAVIRITHEEVELRTALIFGLAGIAGAPLGVWLGGELPQALLLVGFAVLMLIVAARMWSQASRAPQEAALVRADMEEDSENGDSVCRHDLTSGRLRVTSRCFFVLLGSGVLTGLLSGLFGVGAGFIIVPALVLAASLPMRRAVATSLLVIAIVSFAGVMAQSFSGRSLDWWITGLFVLGGLVGMALGMRLSRRLAGPQLQKLFAVLMVIAGAFILLSEVLF